MIGFLSCWAAQGPYNSVLSKLLFAEVTYLLDISPFLDPWAESHKAMLCRPLFWVGGDIDAQVTAGVFVLPGLSMLHMPHWVVSHQFPL